MPSSACALRVIASDHFIGLISHLHSRHKLARLRKNESTNIYRRYLDRNNQCHITKRITPMDLSMRVIGSLDQGNT